MTRLRRRPGGVAGRASRSVTIGTGELGLSITTISRALNGYSDVGEETRVADAAAHGLMAQPQCAAAGHGARNIAWVQSDNDRKFVDPHFVE